MRSRSQTPSLALPVVAAVVVLLVLLAPRMAAAASAGTYYVSPSGSDTRACAADAQATPFATIQKALSCASDGDVVLLAPSGATPYPGIGPVAADVTIEAQPGADARSVTIDAGAGPVSIPAETSVTVSGVALSCIANDCHASTVVNHGTLALSADAVTGNQSIASAILNSTAEGSTAGVLLTLTGSTVSGNAGRLGGAIQSTSGSGAGGPVVLKVLDSTIAGNFSQTVGGGIAVNSPTPGSATTIVNSTITGNSATNAAGGLYAGSPLTLSNTILAANSTRTGRFPDCQDTSSTPAADGTGGHNLLGSADGCPQLRTAFDGDLVGVPHAGLQALANNGGPTDTVALQAGSPALGSGDAATCAAGPIADLDQRGEARNSEARETCDIGAYDSAGDGGTVERSYFVAPQGSDAPTCAGNSQATPFRTIQKALSCASDGDVVELAPSGSSPYPGIGPIGANVTLRSEAAADARTVTIDAGQEAATVAPGANVSFSGVTFACVQHGCLTPLLTDEGALTLSDDAVRQSLSGHSGILETTPAGSASAAWLRVERSTVSGGASPLGGGILSTAGREATGPLGLLIADSTIDGNFAQTVGGGLAVVDATAGSAARIVNSTITGNFAQSGGGGIYAASPVTLANTILAANTVRSGGASPDCQASGTPVADAPAGHNLIGIGSGCPQLLDGVHGDRVGTIGSPLDPLLTPLAFDGGPTESAPPLPGSPALGAGDPATCAAVPIGDLDQRYLARHADSREACDAGAADSGGAKVKVHPVKFRAPAGFAATAGSPVQVKLSAKGSPTPAFTVSSGLPAGLALVDNGDGTAELEGAPGPGTAGSYSITLTATNGAGAPVSHVLTVTVEALSVLPFSTHLQPGGKPVTISVAGSGFRAGATLAASSPGIQVSSMKVHSPSLITAKISAASTVPAGSYDLSVSLPGATASCTGCLQVGSP
jgi:hypothetical protein